MSLKRFFFFSACTRPRSTRHASKGVGTGTNHDRSSKFRWHGSYHVCYDLSQLTNQFGWWFQPCPRHRPHERNDAARDIQKVALNVARRITWHPNDFSDFCSVTFVYICHLCKSISTMWEACRPGMFRISEFGTAVCSIARYFEGCAEVQIYGRVPFGWCGLRMRHENMIR